MNVSQHSCYRFSVTVHTDDKSLLYCMRGLAQRCQESGNSRISWGGTKDDEDWESDGHCVTFHFNASYYRDNFITEANRLFPKYLWDKVRESDSDPAKPQSKRKAD